MGKDGHGGMPFLCKCSSREADWIQQSQTPTQVPHTLSTHRCVQGHAVVKPSKEGRDPPIRSREVDTLRSGVSEARVPGI